MGLVKLLPFALLIVPLAEIGMFILVGGLIGVLPTIALVLLTAVTGATLLRIHGLKQLEAIRAQVAEGRLPGRDIAHGAMMLVAGVLLLTPGFITDTLGFLLFVPLVRDAVYRFLAARIRIVTPQAMGGNGGEARPSARGERTIDLEEDEWRADDAGRASKGDAGNGASPWRKPV
jgi:UPF0716 protein FxsA